MPTTEALWHFGRAVALISKQMIAEAELEKKAFEEAKAKVPPDAMMNLNSSKDLLAVATASLDARLLEAKGDEGAIAAWTLAVTAEDALAYDEPPAWYYPVRESLGGACLRAGRTDTAEQIFREDLKRNPENGRSLFGLAEALKAQKKQSEAAEVTARFKKAWARADVMPTIAGL
jgi:tetratricopeptide (TPR) repeat protein